MPSVTWLQSVRRRRPSTMGLSVSSALKLPGPNAHFLVCASGLALALRMLSSAMACRWRGVEAVTPVVLVGEFAEHVRPHELGVLALVADPGRGGEVLGRLRSWDVAFLLDADDQDAVVAAGLDVGHGAQDGDAAGRAGRLVAGGGLAPQRIVDRGGHGAQLALAGEQLPERVPDVDGFYFAGVGVRAVEGAGHRLGDHVGDLQALARVIPRVVALVAARDPHASAAHISTLQQME